MNTFEQTFNIMDLKQAKRYRSFINLHGFFNDYGTQMATVAPAITADLADFEALYKLVNKQIMIIEDNRGAAILDKDDLKAECRESLWKLVVAMKYHYHLTNNTIAADGVKLSASAFRRLSEKAFFSFAQGLMNDYQPGVYTPYGIEEDEMTALKVLLINFPNQMRACDEERLKRKMALAELNRILKGISGIFKNRIDMLMIVAQAKFPREYKIYKDLRHMGIVNPIAGKPQFSGSITESEIKLIDKQTYRRKRALFVINTGTTPLMGGIGTTDNAFTGTPFLIPPGKTMRRITQKLAPDGEFFLIQNMGEEDGRYEVWIKE